MQAANFRLVGGLWQVPKTRANNRPSPPPSLLSKYLPQWNHGCVCVQPLLATYRPPPVPPLFFGGGSKLSSLGVRKFIKNFVCFLQTNTHTLAPQTYIFLCKRKKTTNRRATAMWNLIIHTGVNFSQFSLFPRRGALTFSPILLKRKIWTRARPEPQETYSLSLALGSLCVLSTLCWHYETSKVCVLLFIICFTAS